MTTVTASDWSRSQCSATCGQGERTRQRSCDGTNFRVTYEDIAQRGDLPCPGAAQERETCAAGPCPAWTPWTPWTACSATCGGGSRQRIRECRKGRQYGDCEGAAEETDTCGEDTCPEWTEWAPWTQCTVSCGGGVRSKVRTCAATRDSGPSCAGEAEVTEDCNTAACPAWSPWAPWTDCSATCGGGQRSRHRDCLLRSGLGCEGEADETASCNEAACPVWTGEL